MERRRTSRKLIPRCRAGYTLLARRVDAERETRPNYTVLPLTLAASRRHLALESKDEPRCPTRFSQLHTAIQEKYHLMSVPPTTSVPSRDSTYVCFIQCGIPAVPDVQGFILHVFVTLSCYSIFEWPVNISLKC